MGTNRKKGAAPPRYDEAFKAGAVKLVTEQGRPSTEVAKELGICIDTQLTLAALDMAVRREKPDHGLVFHSDRGVQYAAAAYRERLAQLGIRQSMSRKGDPYDNAVAENFFSCLKCELIHLRRFDTRVAAQNEIFAYIEGFCNARRPHSAIGWIAPNVFAKQFSQATVA